MWGFLKKAVAVGTSMLLLCGCSSGASIDSVVGQEKDDELEIGMCFDSFVIERWEKDRDVFAATASSLGATVNVQNANGDINKQIEQIRYLIDKKVDCLVIIPIDSTGLKDVVLEAKKAGIPVVCYDRLISDVNADLYISFDNEMVGQMLGDAIASQGAKNVIIHVQTHDVVHVDFIHCIVLVITQSKFVSHLVGQVERMITGRLVTHRVGGCPKGQHGHHC